MVNDSTATERHHYYHHHHHQDIQQSRHHTTIRKTNGLLLVSGKKVMEEEKKRNGAMSSSTNGHSSLSPLSSRHQHQHDKQEEQHDITTTTNGKGAEEEEETGANNISPAASNKEEDGDDKGEEDELTKLNSIEEVQGAPLLPGTALVRQSEIKSATLKSAGSNNSDTSSSFNKKSFSPAGNQQNAFMYNARNNLRRSFTLPRGLLPLRKSGQTGPASENQNGNFVRNIFLTLVRSKSIRKKQQQQQTPPLANNHEDHDNASTPDTTSMVEANNKPSPSKLHGLPPGFVPAAIGLKNQGNTCFMNAIVQCLSHTDSFSKYLVSENYKSDLRKKHWIKNGKSEVTEELAAILKNAWLRQNATVLEETVTRFKSAVEKGATQWRGSEQHDAQEFFLWLLDKLHEDLNQASSNKYKQLKNNFGRPEEQVAAEALANHLRCNNSIVQDIFGAHFRSSLTCPGCGKQSATFDPFLSVSLPIPQAKHDVPVYVNIIYLSQQPRQVKLGLSVSSCADIKELKQLLATDTNIEENDILLTEVDGEGFHRTFTETQLVSSSIANNDALYCIETPQMRETSESDGAFLMITWTNLILTNEDKTKVRFGSTYVTQIARETSFVDLQKVMLKEMSAMLQPGILVAEQKDPVFNIRILDGSLDGSLVDPLVEHPLYMEAVDHALSLCDEDVPPHIKLHLEWQTSDKEKIIGDDSESVEEHASIAQTKQRHAEEPVGTVTLGECFDLYTTAEQLSPEDSWHCPHCNRKEQGTLKMIGLWTAPQALVVHLKRFRQTAKGRVAATKISSVVDFPVDGLDLGPHVAKHSKVAENVGSLVNGSSLNPVSSPINGCFGLGNWKNRASFKKHISSTNTVNHHHKTAAGNVQQQNGSSTGEGDGMIYDLYAVCNHHGKDMLGGHYTAYCKNPVDGSWWSFDDTRVTKLDSPSDIKTASAYILFYTKRSSGGSSLNNQPFQPFSQTQHWCKSLIKKYHKVPPPPLLSSTSNGHGGGDSLMEKKECVEPSSSIIPPIKEDPTDDVVVEGTSSSSSAEQPPFLVNGYHNSVSLAPSNNANNPGSTSLTSTAAPLARMDDVSLNVCVSYVKDMQIESTV